MSPLRTLIRRCHEPPELATDGALDSAGAEEELELLDSELVVPLELLEVDGVEELVSGCAVVEEDAVVAGVASVLSDFAAAALAAASRRALASLARRAASAAAAFFLAAASFAAASSCASAVAAVARWLAEALGGRDAAIAAVPAAVAAVAPSATASLVLVTNRRPALRRSCSRS